MPVTRHAISHDVMEHAHNLSHWDQTYAQLNRGAFEGRLDEIWCGDLQLFRERTSIGVLQSGSPWAGSRTFGVPLAMDREGIFCGRGLLLDSLMTLGPRDLLDFRAPAGMDIVGITLDARAFAAFSCASEHHNWEDALRGRPVISAPPAQMAQMRDFLREIFATVEVTPTRLARAAVRVTLRDQILERLCRVLSAADPEPAESFTTAVRRDIVARAREFAAHAPDQPLTVAGLCRALKVSRRTLQICFQEMLAVSPHQYLQALRLNGLRRALQRSDSGVYSVHQAAAQWGFWHLSACAADYKRMFGELPSTTLRTRLQSRVAPR